MSNIPKYDEFYFASNMIFQLIEPEKRILDVGCGTGRLAEKLRLRKKCYVVGIERDESAAKFAQQRCDKLLIADVESLREIPFENGFFDIIVFADVLEHLLDPEAVLRKFKKYLSDSGYIFVSIPNVANWFIRLKLVAGKWNYKEAGLLDKTHVRFFTLKTVKEMIQRCGYTIMYLGCTSGLGYMDWRVISRNPANLWKSLLGYQFMIKAKKLPIGTRTDREVKGGSTSSHYSSYLLKINFLNPILIRLIISKNTTEQEES